jgi:acyl-CoA reductase-like NAD-dependent aldehyde dehydrogenase
MSERLEVRKTYKLFIGGAFPRSESGRTYEVRAADGSFLANAALASRKDGRDAVLAARKGFGSWSSATAYNRGQVLYRVAEVMEGRRDQFVAELTAAGSSPEQAVAEVDASIDLWVWYAGWTDKLAQVLGAANPVAGPYFNFSLPEPTGVVVVVAPERPSLLGLVGVLGPVLAAGNAAIALASTSAPLPAITLTEVLATSDVPGGVVNVLTGQQAEILPWLANHGDVDGLDLAGVSDASLATSLEAEAAGTLKRVRGPRPAQDWGADPGLAPLRAFVETKTVWHTQGV